MFSFVLWLSGNFIGLRKKAICNVQRKYDDHKILGVLKLILNGNCEKLLQNSVHTNKYVF